MLDDDFQLRALARRLFWLPMKRPLGVTVTAIWMGVLLVALVTLAGLRGVSGPFLVMLVAVMSVAPVVPGLWRGRAWASRSFRLLLGLACVLAFLAGAAAIFSATPRRPPSHYFIRGAVMALWLAYFLRPNVRAYFGEPQALALAGARRRALATLE